MTMVSDGIGWLAGYWANQLGGTFFGTGSTLSIFGLVVTVLIAAFLAVPRGRRAMPRLAVWRRALFPRRIFSSASGRADLWWFAFSLFGYGLLFGWAVLSSVQIAALLRGMIGPVAPLGLPPLVAGAVLTLLLYLAYEFAYWLDHYLSHAVPLLWQFHAVHHSAESLSLLTTFRVHPVDTIVFANITAIMIGVTQGLAGPLLGGTARRDDQRGQCPDDDRRHHAHPFTAFASVGDVRPALGPVAAEPGAPPDPPFDRRAAPQSQFRQYLRAVRPAVRHLVPARRTPRATALWRGGRRHAAAWLAHCAVRAVRQGLGAAAAQAPPSCATQR
ncbi:sterol desaturase family protein [Sphingomonas sp. TF3]|nr:sterol desaturase family protein [Sphingomonas sp. TF3]RUN77401.1 sterol desaturase family protein [Sphingomonas sp. TF3]